MELQLSLLTSLRFVHIDIYDWGYGPHPELIPGLMSILKRKLVSVETISISLQMFVLVARRGINVGINDRI
jgi:hypothetical protein